MPSTRDSTTIAVPRPDWCSATVKPSDTGPYVVIEGRLGSVPGSGLADVQGSTATVGGLSVQQVQQLVAGRVARPRPPCPPGSWPWVRPRRACPRGGWRCWVRCGACGPAHPRRRPLGRAEDAAPRPRAASPRGPRTRVRAAWWTGRASGADRRPGIRRAGDRACRRCGRIHRGVEHLGARAVEQRDQHDAARLHGHREVLGPVDPELVVTELHLGGHAGDEVGHHPRLGHE